MISLFDPRSFVLANELLEDIIAVELIIIVFTILSTYLIKSFEVHYTHRREKKINAIENYLRAACKSKKAANFSTIPSAWRNIDLLYNAMKNIDSPLNTEKWAAVKLNLIKTALHPLAQKNANSKRWTHRFFSAEIFSLYAEPNDESAIIHLVNDPINLVYLHAIPAAIHLSSEKAINDLITRCAKLNWLTQMTSLSPFDNAPTSITTIVLNRLTQSTEPSVRVTCYNLLRKAKPSSITWDIHRDLYCDHFELRLSALKFIAAFNSEDATPILINRLKDEQWEIRLVAIHRLGHLKIQSAIQAIADCLDDTNDWVKFSAAEVLKSFGHEGNALLQRRAPDLKTLAYDINDHLSHTLW